MLHRLLVLSRFSPYLPLYWFSASSGLRFFCLIGHFTSLSTSFRVILFPLPGDHGLGHVSTPIPNTCTTLQHVTFHSFHNCLCYCLSFLIISSLTSNILDVLPVFSSKHLFSTVHSTLQTTVQISQQQPTTLSATV